MFCPVAWVSRITIDFKLISSFNSGDLRRLDCNFALGAYPENPVRVKKEQKKWLSETGMANIRHPFN
jgi:hypothetical protein